MTPATESPPRRRPSVLLTVLLVVAAIPALVFTACGASLFVASVSSGANGLPLAGLGLLCAIGGGGVLYALYRVSRGA